MLPSTGEKVNLGLRWSEQVGMQWSFRNQNQQAISVCRSSVNENAAPRVAHLNEVVFEGTRSAALDSRFHCGAGDLGEASCRFRDPPRSPLIFLPHIEYTNRICQGICCQQIPCSNNIKANF